MGTITPVTVLSMSCEPLARTTVRIVRIVPWAAAPPLSPHQEVEVMQGSAL